MTLLTLQSVFLALPIWHRFCPPWPRKSTGCPIVSSLSISPGLWICSDICTTPFQRPVAWQIWPRPHNTQKFSTKLNYIRLEVRGPPAQAVKTSDTDGQGKSGRRICSPPCRTADCTGLGSWCMESRTKTWARAMFFSSEIGMRVVHLVQAGREHCIDWLVEDERRAATSSSSNPSQANSTHPTHKRASRIKSGKRGLVQATGYAINSTIFFMHFPLL